MTDPNRIDGIDVFEVIGNLPNVWYWKAVDLQAASNAQIKQAKKRRVPIGYPDDDIETFTVGAELVALMLLGMCIETSLKALCIMLGHKPADRKKFSWPWKHGETAHDLACLVDWFKSNTDGLSGVEVPDDKLLYRLSQYIELGRYPAQFHASRFAKANSWHEESDGVLAEVLSSAPRRFEDSELSLLSGFAGACIKQVVHFAQAGRSTG